MDPIQLIIPGGLFQAALITIVTCYSSSKGAARNDLIGIRLWSTLYSDKSWQAGHRAALPWSWVLGAIAVVSFAVGVWLVKQEAAAVVHFTTWYTVSTIFSFMAITGLMIWRTHVAANNTAIDEFLADEAKEKETTSCNQADEKN